MRQHVLALEEERVTGGLRSGEHHREIARVLVDLGVAGLALLLQPLERRYDGRHELEDDRCRDVRHDPEREERELLERLAREEVEQAERAAGTGSGREELLERGLVDARGRDVRTEAVDRKDTGGEEDAPTQLGDAPGVREPREHALLLFL